MIIYGRRVIFCKIQYLLLIKGTLYDQYNLAMILIWRSVNNIRCLTTWLLPNVLSFEMVGEEGIEPPYRGSECCKIKGTLFANHIYVNYFENNSIIEVLSMFSIERSISAETVSSTYLICGLPASSR